MKDNYLDSRSPYIKNDINSMVKTRKNVLSFKTDEEKESSDTLLRQKITNISKRIVGEEIRKFAEVASHEISEEFASLEKRLEQNIQKSLYKSLGENIKDSVSTFGYDIGRELDSKILELTSLITEIDSKLENLEYYSKSLEEKIEENIKVKEESIYNSPVFKIETIKKEEVGSEYDEEIGEEDINNEDNNENEEEIINIIENGILIPVQNKEVSNDDLIKEIINEIIKEGNKEKKIVKEKRLELYTETKNTKDEVYNDEILLADDPEYTQKLNYITEKLGNILPKFEKKGFLFKKNTFTSTIKDLNAENFLKNREKFTELNEEDKDNIEKILGKIKLNPKKEESIGEFLKRAFLNDYNSNR